MAYELRYFFDPGSGVCLWASNDEAKERFGYPVDHWQLPLSENTRRFIQHLVAWFDTSLDWASPSDTDDRWSIEELERFKIASAKGLNMLKEELRGHGYTFTDETAA